MTLSRLRFWFPALAGAACLGLGPGLVSLYGFFVEPLSREFGVSANAIRNWIQRAEGQMPPGAPQGC